MTEVVVNAEVREIGPGRIKVEGFYPSDLKGREQVHFMYELGGLYDLNKKVRYGTPVKVTFDFGTELK